MGHDGHWLSCEGRESWIVVPDSAVIKGPNRIGYAIVWLYGSLNFDGSRMVRCFLPGPTT